MLRDVSKAFDKVWHRGLLYKLVESGVPERLVRLLASYLSDRRARVRMEDHLGPPSELFA